MRRHGGQSSIVGGLVGYNEHGRLHAPTTDVINSYWSSSGLHNLDRSASAPTTENGNDIVDGGETNTVHGFITSDLQTPTGYTGLYINWDNYDQDGNAGTRQPWCFGGTSDLPTLKDADGNCR